MDELLEIQKDDCDIKTDQYVLKFNLPLIIYFKTVFIFVSDFN